MLQPSINKFGSYLPPQTVAAKALARLGDHKGALRIGRNRPEVLTQVAIECARQGCFTRALSIAEEFDDVVPRSELVRTVAIQRARSGDIDGAVETAQMLSPSRRVLLLIDIASIATEQGDQESANMILQHTIILLTAAFQPGRRCRFLLDAAAVQQRTGNRSDVLATIRVALEDARCAATHRPVQFDFLRAVGIAYARAGAAEAASNVFQEAIAKAEARKVGTGWVSKVQIYDELREIALAQAEAGLFEDALSTARASVPEDAPTGGAAEDLDFTKRPRLGQILPDMLARLYSDQTRALVQIYLLQGDLDEALSEYARLREASSYYLMGYRLENAEVLLGFCRARVSEGDLLNATRAADAMAPSSQKAEAMLAIATALANAGRIGEAIRVADGITYPELFVVTGDPPEARPVFCWEEPSTWGILYDPTTYGRAWGLISTQNIAASLAASAIRFDLTVGPSAERDYATAFQEFDPPVLRALARTHAEIHDPRDALAWCVKIRDPDRRLGALVGLAEGIAGECSGLEVRPP